MHRIDVLARRVRWLDRYRRTLAILTSVVATPLLVYQFLLAVGLDWPKAHVMMLGIMLAIITWWLTEVALAWLAAVWETEHDRLSTSLGLPVARLVRRARAAGK